MRSGEIEQVWQGAKQCSQCAIRHLALFSDLKHEDFELIHQPIDKICFHSGEIIYQEKEEGNYLYTLHDGLVKLVQYLPDGTQRTVRLLQKGDVMGLERLLDTAYQHSAIVLQTLTVCRLPVVVIQRLCNETPRLHQQLMQRWQNALSDADAWLVELSTGPSKARVVRLLMRQMQASENGEFELLSREDIGAVLGITTETASRIIADYKRIGLIGSTEADKVTIDLNHCQSILDYK